MLAKAQREAADIIRAEKKSEKLLSIGFQPRMDLNMQKIREIVQSGALGRVYYIQTGGGRRRGIPNSTFIEKKTAGIAPWAISAAIRWTWCSTPSAIPAR